MVLWIKIPAEGEADAQNCVRILALPQVLYAALGKSLSLVCLIFLSQKWGDEKCLCSPGSLETRPACSAGAGSLRQRCRVILFGSTGSAVM